MMEIGNSDISQAEGSFNQESEDIEINLSAETGK